MGRGFESWWTFSLAQLNYKTLEKCEFMNVLRVLELNSKL